MPVCSELYFLQNKHTKLIFSNVILLFVTVSWASSPAYCDLSGFIFPPKRITIFYFIVHHFIVVS